MLDVGFGSCVAYMILWEKTWFVHLGLLKDLVEFLRYRFQVLAVRV